MLLKNNSQQEKEWMSRHDQRRRFEQAKVKRRREEERLERCQEEQECRDAARWDAGEMRQLRWIDDRCHRSRSGSHSRSRAELREPGRGIDSGLRIESAPALVEISDPDEEPWEARKRRKHWNEQKVT